MPKLHGRDAEKKWVDLSGSGSGSAGTPGKDGYSPTATVEQTEDGAVITIIDKTGTTSAAVTNGKDGDDGETPEMTVMRIDSTDGVGGYTLVTFTLGEEQKSFTVYDGTNGRSGVGIESIEKISTDGLVDTYKINYTPIPGGAMVDPTYFTVTNGSPGKDGTDAAVTATNIAAALGYTPVNPDNITLGLHSDGKYYIFVDNVPVGTGFELSGNNGDVYGYIDANNNIVLNGDLADGNYSIKYETEDGKTIDIGDLVLDTNVYYSVTNALTNCTNSNSATQVIAGQSYSATITANSGYELESVTVTMGGSPVTVSGGSISIASVTGNIVITAVAEEVQAAEPVIVDIGLTKNYSITTDTGELRGSQSVGFCTTEWIDVSNIPKPCTINLTKAKWVGASADETGYVRFYVTNVSGAKLAGDYTYPSKMPNGVTMVLNNNDITDVTVTVTSSNIGKLRFAGNWTYKELDDITGAGVNMVAEATLTYTPA